MNEVIEAERTQVPQVAQQGNATLLTAIARAASDPAMDMDKVERLFKMHEKMVAQQAKAEFNAALSRAQQKIEPIATDAENDHTRSRYAKLAAINRAIVPLYTAEGLSVSFDTETKNETDPIPQGHIRTIAIVAHAAGHERRYHIDLTPDDVGAKGNTNKTAVQAAGSTNEYARRYLVRMIFNVSTFDDTDGNKPTESLLQEQFDAYVKRIKEQTKKAEARKVYNEAVQECKRLQDVASANRLKEEVLAHEKFIDEANKVTQ